MSRTTLHPLTIASTRALPDGIAIAFAIPAELASTFSFIPGQYLSLEDTIDEETVRRSYSICSYHKDEQLEVGIKRVEGGVFSTHALSLKPGDQVHVLPPDGRFTTPIDAKNQHHYLLIAAGSGITPCLSIAKSVLRDEPDSQITLLFGNRRIASMMFREDLTALKDLYTTRFNMINMLSAERQDSDLFNGRITGELLHTFSDTGLLGMADFHSAYLCGPLDMVNSVAEALSKLGMNNEQIHRELFTTGNLAATAREIVIDESVVSTGQSVTIYLDGTQSDITVDATRDTVLSAARRAGIDMPFSCAGGMCCTCRCKVLEGETAMDANFSLAQWEIDSGYTLACQARPTTDRVVLDFDAT